MSEPCVSDPQKFWVCKGDVAFSTGYLVPSEYVLRCKKCSDLLSESIRSNDALKVSVLEIRAQRDSLSGENVDLREALAQYENTAKGEWSSSVLVWTSGGVLGGFLLGAVLVWSLR